MKMQLRTTFLSDKTACIALCFLVVLFALFIRLTTLPMIETGGDAVGRWYRIKGLIGGWEPWIWNHHTARFGVNIPVILVQLLLGPSVVYYYVPTLLVFVFSVFLVFQIGLKVSGRATAVLASALYILFPAMIRNGAQLLPNVYTACFILLTVWLILIAVESQRRKTLLFVLAASAMFLTYGTKVQALFFLPGILVAIFVLENYRWKHVVIFAGSLAAMYVVEHLLLLANGFDLGRFQVISSSFGVPPGVKSRNFSGVLSLFERYTVLRGEWGPLLLLFGASTIYLIYNRLNVPRNLKAVLLVTLSFFFFMTFSVRSLDPLLPVQSYHDRYLIEAIPLVCLVISAAALSLVSYLRRGWAGSAVYAVFAATLLLSLSFLRGDWFAGDVGILAGSLVALGVLKFFEKPGRGFIQVIAVLILFLIVGRLAFVDRFAGFDSYAWVRVKNYENLATEALQSGIPIIAFDSSKGIQAFQRLFVSKEVLPLLRSTSHPLMLDLDGRRAWGIATVKGMRPETLETQLGSDFLLIKRRPSLIAERILIESFADVENGR